MSYQIYADGNRQFSSNCAKRSAAVAVSWKKQGYKPKAWSVYSDPVTCVEVTITTISATAKALANA